MRGRLGLLLTAVRPATVLLTLMALAPYDGLLLVAPLPDSIAALVGGWKEALVVVLVVVSWHRWRTAPGPRGDGATVEWAVPIGLLVALATLTAVIRPGVASVLGLKVGFFYLLVPLALWWAPLDRRGRDRLVTILMVNGLVTSLVGLGQQLLGGERLNALGYEYNEVIRFSGGFLRSFSTFNQPFPFAFYVMLVLLVCLPVALTDRRRPRNQLFLLATPVLVVGLSSAFVRGALLGLAAGVLYLAVRRHRILLHVVLALPLAAAVAVALGGVDELLSPTSLQERVGGWVEVVWDEGVEPLGTGVGSTGAAAERVGSGSEPGTFPTEAGVDRFQPDNYYVKTLVELGPIGLWLLLAGLVVLWRCSARAEHEATTDDPSARSLVLGVRAAILAAVVAATVATFWEIFPADLLFWTLTGVMSSTCRPDLRRSASTVSPSALVGAASKPTVASSSPR